MFIYIYILNIIDSFILVSEANGSANHDPSMGSNNNTYPRPKKTAPEGAGPSPKENESVPLSGRINDPPSEGPKKNMSKFILFWDFLDLSLNVLLI